MIDHKIISSILIAALSLNAVKPAQAQVQALPLVGAACSNPATCVVVGAVVVGSVIYLILKDSTGQEHKLPVYEPKDEASGNAHMKLPENVKQVYPEAHITEIFNYADTQTECKQWFDDLTQTLRFRSSWRLIITEADDPEDPTGRKKEYQCKARLYTSFRFFNEQQPERTMTRRRRN